MRICLYVHLDRRPSPNIVQKGYVFRVRLKITVKCWNLERAQILHTHQIDHSFHFILMALIFRVYWYNWDVTATTAGTATAL